MTLCSRVNKVCSILKPIHQLPLTPVISTPVAGSSGSRPSAPIASLPPSPDRTFASVAASLPYSWEPSHQCVAVLRYVGGKSSEPGVVIAERDFPGILFLVLSMTEPVVNHELDPGGSQHIEDGDRLKAIASQQFEADRAGIRHKNPRFVGIDIFQWDIAPEACSGTAHRRMFQVVVSSIR